MMLPSLFVFMQATYKSSSTLQSKQMTTKHAQNVLQTALFASAGKKKEQSLQNFKKNAFDNNLLLNLREAVILVTTTCLFFLFCQGSCIKPLATSMWCIQIWVYSRWCCILSHGILPSRFTQSGVDSTQYCSSHLFNFWLCLSVHRANVIIVVMFFIWLCFHVIIVLSCSKTYLCTGQYICESWRPNV